MKFSLLLIFFAAKYYVYGLLFISFLFFQFRTSSLFGVRIISPLFPSSHQSFAIHMKVTENYCTTVGFFFVILLNGTSFFPCCFILFCFVCFFVVAVVVVVFVLFFTFLSISNNFAPRHYSYFTRKK